MALKKYSTSLTIQSVLSMISFASSRSRSESALASVKVCIRSSLAVAPNTHSSSPILRPGSIGLPMT